MAHLPINATDDDLIRFIDEWASLMEKEDYDGAFAHTGHVAAMSWTPQLLREIVKNYDECDPNQTVTVQGLPTDIQQHKEVTRSEGRRAAGIGYIWYDLNINGYASDLTATFDLDIDGAGLVVKLNDIHVM